MPSASAQLARASIGACRSLSVANGGPPVESLAQTLTWKSLPPVTTAPGSSKRHLTPPLWAGKVLNRIRVAGSTSATEPSLHTRGARSVDAGMCSGLHGDPEPHLRPHHNEGGEEETYAMQTTAAPWGRSVTTGCEDGGASFHPPCSRQEIPGGNTHRYFAAYSICLVYTGAKRTSGCRFFLQRAGHENLLVPPLWRFYSTQEGWRHSKSIITDTGFEIVGKSRWRTLQAQAAHPRVPTGPHLV